MCKKTTTYNNFENLPLGNGNFESDDYRFGFGGFEKDNEISGEGNHLSFADYGYDPRTGRRWNIDPLTSKYPFASPYATFNCNPILYDDPTGKSGEASINKQTKTITVTSVFVFYGSGSSPEIAKQTASTIQKAYNDAHATVKVDGVVYNVQFKIVGVDANSVLSKFDKKTQEAGLEKAITNNKDIRANYVRLENESDNWSGSSYTDGQGANTGYWSTDQIAQNGGTTEPHEYNHSLGGLDHPETLNPDGGNQDQEPSIDMTINSYNYAKPKYRKTDADGSVTVDITKRQVRQKNISALFTKDVVNQLKTSGKANIGKITNEYHKKK
jgi:hypothetical protein